MRGLPRRGHLPLLFAYLAGRASAKVIETEVVVVGGGLSGLVAANTLKDGGFTDITVLEAKETIGGRCRSVERKTGPGIIELGATWINNKTQPEIYALTELYGLQTAVQWYEGDVINEDLEGNIHRIDKEVDTNTEDPETSELVQLLYFMLQEVSLEVDLENFEAFPEEWDVTMAEWIELNDTLAQSEHVKATMSSLSAQLVGRESHEVGAHFLLDYIGSGRGLSSLGGEDEDGAQYLKVKQGTSAIVQGLADDLKPVGNVHTDSPVVAITHCNGHVLVTTSCGRQFQAKKVIMANPTNTYKDINFEPALPEAKHSIVSQTMPGIYAKLIVNYEKPWWRDAGLMGEFLSLRGPVCFTWDTSDGDLGQYSLAVFVAGDVARSWHELPGEEEKHDAVITHLAQLAEKAGGEELGDEARRPIEINMAEWTLEPYLEGGPTSSSGPGQLRKYGKALREPFDDIHFAGGETAYKWKGYLEGAVLAGQRAGKEVIRSLGGETE